MVQNKAEHCTKKRKMTIVENASTLERKCYLFLIESERYKCAIHCTFNLNHWILFVYEDKQAYINASLPVLRLDIVLLDLDFPTSFKNSFLFTPMADVVLDTRKYRRVTEHFLFD